jgi:hypothetical protein
MKAACVCATTANITLSGLQTIDGVAVVANDRVLVKNQTTTSQNGIYVASTGTWTRAYDFDGDSDIVYGTRVFVIGGTTNTKTDWYVSTASPSIGSALAFTQIVVTVASTPPTGSITVSGYTQSTARLLGRTTAATGAIQEISVGAGLTMAAGSLTNALVSGTDYVAPGSILTSGLTQATARLLGRSTAGTGAIEAISIGTGLSLSGGTLSNTVTTNPGGATLIASGTLSGSTVTFTSLAATYAYLVLQLTGLSFDSITGSPAPLVQASTNNGSSYDTTAGNYSGSYVTGATAAAMTQASMVQSDPITNAGDTFTATVTILGYQGGTHPSFRARAVRNAGTPYHSTGNYIGSTSAINALRVYFDGTRTFDAGTYALYGVS